MVGGLKDKKVRRQNEVIETALTLSASWVMPNYQGLHCLLMKSKLKYGGILYINSLTRPVKLHSAVPWYPGVVS
jgi:hypothetical protein